MVEVSGSDSAVIDEFKKLAKDHGKDSEQNVPVDMDVGVALGFLADMPAPISLPKDWNCYRKNNDAKSVHHVPIEANLSRRIFALAESNKSNLFVVLIALYKILIYRYSRQADIVICVIEEEAVGVDRFECEPFFLRDNIEKDDSFKTFLVRLQDNYFLQKEIQAGFSLGMLDDLGLSDEVLSSIMQFTISFVKAEPGDRLPWEIKRSSSHTDLALVIYVGEEGIKLSFYYAQSKFKLSSIDRFSRHFINVVKCVAKNPEVVFDVIQYADAEERRRVLTQFSQKATRSVNQKCLHHMIFDDDSKCSAKVAVKYQEETISYKQLNEQSYILAMHLQSLGLKPNDLVGIYIDRSINMLVAILGILRSGAAYLPLDPTHPKDRLSYIINDSNISIVLTQERYCEDSVLEVDCQIICLDSGWGEINNKVKYLKRNGVSLRAQAEPNDLAYVLYTSGSTGKPKGVMIEHYSVVNFLTSMCQMPGISAEDRLLAISTYCFDISVLEFLLPLVAKAQVCIASSSDAVNGERLYQLIAHYNPTFIQATPSTWQMLRYAGFVPGVDQTILCGGEAMSEELREYFIESGANAWNMFGPTETTVWSTGERITAESGIGYPIDNTTIYILDSNLEPQGIGVEGELYIAGAGLARGYLNRTELTKERFVSNPFEQDKKMYRTGDLACWKDDGRIQYLGRVDTQVKIRGFRIEIGEIEECMRLIDGVEDAVVVVQGEGELKHLVGFYTSNNVAVDTQRMPNTKLITMELERHLPAYMIPKVFEPLRVIPLNTNGKVDRLKLQKYKVSKAAATEFQAARDEVELGLVRILSDVLDIELDAIGIHDNFFDLGGNSLLAVKYIGLINAVFERDLPVAILFQDASVAQIACLVKSNKEISFETLVPIQSRGTKTPIFVVPGAGGNILSLLPLSNALGDDQPLYGLQAIGIDGKDEPLDNVKDIASINVAAIKEIRPVGPYRLIGYSNGGITAFEMARQLLNEKLEVEALILFDSFIPSLIRNVMGASAAFMMYQVCTTVATLFEIELDLDITDLESVPENQLVQTAAFIMTEHGLDMPEAQFNTLFNVFLANQRAVNQYEPVQIETPFRVSLFCTDDEQAYIKNAPADYGWNKYLTLPVSVYKVRGDHFSMLEEENVSDLVRQLAFCLGEDVSDKVV
ncbi:non-ribosomal peptide synthetase [Teredinibacter turnerae]|uniref:non-ribosomal peptide synthetase n=1 Tax=Teredinibacter turnerae TaxID=2426 RepID=UPI0005F86982|nr:non-ribosomal peptide synthetase [Teredinibacter turnerae]